MTELYGKSFILEVFSKTIRLIHDVFLPLSQCNNSKTPFIGQSKPLATIKAPVYLDKQFKVRGQLFLDSGAFQILFKNKLSSCVLNF